MRGVANSVLSGSVLLLVGSPLARAWNGYGHELSAYIAYQDLKPETKKRVNELLQETPRLRAASREGLPLGVRQGSLRLHEGGDVTGSDGRQIARSRPEGTSRRPALRLHTRGRRGPSTTC